MANVKQPHPRLIRLAREVGALPGEQPSEQPIAARPTRKVNRVLAKLWSLLSAGGRFAR